MVPAFTIVFEVNGNEKRLNFKDVPYSAWSELKASLGFTPITVQEALGDWDLEALEALVWLERKQRERKLDLSKARREIAADPPDIHLVDILKDGKSLTGGEDESEPEADPTTGSDG